jgi:hypothetical protein
LEGVKFFGGNKIMKLKLKRRIIFTGKTKKTRRLVWVTLAGLFVLSKTAGAQSVIAPTPTVSTTPPAVQEAPDAMQVFSPENPIATFPDEDQPLQVGPVTLRPHLFYQFLYGGGIQSAPGQSHDTIVQTFAPGMLLVLSPRWTLDYTPTFTFYSQDSFQNNVGQAVTLTGGAVYGNWAFGLSQNFSYTSVPQVQTGTQTDQENSMTTLAASTALNSKISIDLGLTQTLNFPDGFQISREWSTLDWLNYEFWPRLTAGVGAGVGYLDASEGSVFEQLLARAAWRPTDKISFQGNVGGQFTEFTAGGEDSLVTPTFGASIQYQPFEQTKISLGANRAVVPSYYENQISIVTSVSAGVRQRLLGRFFLDVNAAYNLSDYTAAASGVTADSSADYYSVNVQLSTEFLKRGTVAVFYNYSDNVTSQSGLAFSSSQIGFNIGFRY